MEFEKAKKICKDFIEENKDRRIILHDAIETVISTSEELEKENNILKIYLSQQCLISDYIRFKRRNQYNQK